MRFYNNTYTIEELVYNGKIYPNATICVLAKIGQIEDFDYEITSIELLNEQFQPTMILVEKGLDKYLTTRQNAYIERMFRNDYVEYSTGFNISELENNEIIRHKFFADYL